MSAEPSAFGWRMPWRHPWRDAVVFSAIALLQLLLWNTYFWREIAWHQPEYYDQAGLLLASYRLEQAVLEHGLGAILSYLRTEAPFNGLLLSAQGALVALVTGGTRLPRLAVNFGFALLAQLVVFRTARRLGGGSAAGFAALGLMLSLASPWLAAGGLFDFRHDYAAAALYGLWACCIARSAGMLHRRASAVALLLALAMVPQRMVAVAYLLGAYGGWAVLCGAAALLLRRQPALAAGFRQRGWHALASLVILALALSALLLWQWHNFHAYYVEGHLVGEERLARAREQGVFTLLDHLAYYPVSLARIHLGRGFWAGAGLLLAAALAWRRRPTGTLLVALAPLLLAVAVPLVVLGLDVSKSPVVVGIATLPLVLATVLLATALARPGSPLLRAAAAAVLLLGGWQALAQASRHSEFHAQRANLGQLAELDAWLVQQASARGWPALNISVDVVAPWFNANAAAAAAYERSGQLMPVNMRLGSRVDSMTLAEAEAQLAASNVLVLSDRAGSGVLPFDTSMAAMAPALRALAARDWVPVRQLGLGTDTLHIYLRRQP